MPGGETVHVGGDEPTSVVGCGELQQVGPETGVCINRNDSWAGLCDRLVSKSPVRMPCLGSRRIAVPVEHGSTLAEELEVQEVHHQLKRGTDRSG